MIPTSQIIRKYKELIRDHLSQKLCAGRTPKVREKERLDRPNPHKEKEIIGT